MERRRSSEEPEVGVRILERARSMLSRMVASTVVKEGVVVPTRSRETELQRWAAASRATFLRTRWSSMALRGLDRPSCVSVLPPMTLRKSELTELRPVVTRPLF